MSNNALRIITTVVVVQWFALGLLAVIMPTFSRTQRLFFNAFLGEVGCFFLAVFIFAIWNAGKD
jgi:hypothetical protein